MFKKAFIYSAAVGISLLLYACGASTGSRYEDKKEKPEEKKDSKEFVEDFDLTNYRATIDIEEKEAADNTLPDNIDIWYEYPEGDTTSVNRIITGVTDGYRVQVYITDNLDEANQMRSDLYFKTDQKKVYVIFDPPFYKVKVGDFTNMNEANELNFKLTQLGYTEARVVKDSVNVFQ